MFNWNRKKSYGKTKKKCGVLVWVVFVCLFVFVFSCFVVVVVCFNRLKHLTCLVLKKLKTDSGVVCHTYLLDLTLDLCIWSSLFTPDGQRPTRSLLCKLTVVILIICWNRPHYTNPEFDKWFLLEPFVLDKLLNLEELHAAVSVKASCVAKPTTWNSSSLLWILKCFSLKYIWTSVVHLLLFAWFGYC